MQHSRPKGCAGEIFVIKNIGSLKGKLNVRKHNKAIKKNNINFHYCNIEFYSRNRGFFRKLDYITLYRGIIYPFSPDKNYLSSMSLPHKI